MSDSSNEGRKVWADPRAREMTSKYGQRNGTQEQSKPQNETGRSTGGQSPQLAPEWIRRAKAEVPLLSGPTT